MVVPLRPASGDGDQLLFRVAARSGTSCRRAAESGMTRDNMADLDSERHAMMSRRYETAAFKAPGHNRAGSSWVPQSNKVLPAWQKR